MLEANNELTDHQLKSLKHAWSSRVKLLRLAYNLELKRQRHQDTVASNELKIHDIDKKVYQLTHTKLQDLFGKHDIAAKGLINLRITNILNRYYDTEPAITLYEKQLAEIEYAIEATYCLIQYANDEIARLRTSNAIIDTKRLSLTAMVCTYREEAAKVWHNALSNISSKLDVSYYTPYVPWHIAACVLNNGMTFYTKDVPDEETSN